VKALLYYFLTVILSGGLRVWHVATMDECSEVVLKPNYVQKNKTL